MLRNDIEHDDTVLVAEMLSESFRKEQVLMPRSTAAKKANTSNTENEKKDEDDDHGKDEKYFDKKGHHVAQDDQIAGAVRRESFL